MEAVTFDSMVHFVSAVARSLNVELAFVVFFGSLYLLTHGLKPKVGSLRTPKTACVWVPERRNHGQRLNARGASVQSDRADECLQADKNPTTEQLCDEEWFSKNILQMKTVQVQRTINLYKSAKDAGLDLTKLPAARGVEVFVALVTAAVRAEHPREVLGMMRECRRCGFKVTQAMLASVTKLCTSKQFYKECLAIYDLAIEDPSLAIDDRSVWSCLLFCSVEARAFSRCNFIWKKLQESGRASHKDYGNMVRYASSQRDWHLTLSLIREMREANLEVDNVVYNTVLATCVGAGQVEEGRALLEEMERSDGVVDVITYNTLAKGYAKLGRVNECFKLYKHMRSRGLAPSQVTYGILLDCCINENQMDLAVSIFDSMVEEGCPMNTILFTTLIKGFARANQVDKAMEVYAKMLDSKDAMPDLITFSVLIKANADSGRLDEALKLLSVMQNMNLAPDEVVYNNVLSGCVQQANCRTGKDLYQSMVRSGLRPSNATFSIMIRLYSAGKLLDDALELLRTEPAKFKVDLEPRVFVQLTQAFLRERNGRAAIEAFGLMVRSTDPSPAMISSLSAMCLKLNMLGTAVEMLQMSAEVGATVEMRDVQKLREAVSRKKKVQLLEQIDLITKSVQG